MPPVDDQPPSIAAKSRIIPIVIGLAVDVIQVIYAHHGRRAYFDGYVVTIGVLNPTIGLLLQIPRRHIWPMICWLLSDKLAVLANGGGTFRRDEYSSIARLFSDAYEFKFWPLICIFFAFFWFS